MNKQRFPRSHAAWAVLALLAAVGTASARTPTKAELDEAIARHRAEVAACKAGQTTQSLTDCIRDADGALVVAKRGELDSDTESYRRNQQLRCAPLPEDLRKDCLLRMSGAGLVEGSVAEGGIYRELTTIEVGPVPEPEPLPAIDPPAAK